MGSSNVRSISVRLGADVNNFVQGMQAANNKMSTVSTQMRTQMTRINANTSLMIERLKLSGRESEITGVKMQGLTQKISIQSGYVRRLSTELDAAKLKFGETSREVQKLEIQLLRASKVEAQMKNELNSLKAPTLDTGSGGGGGAGLGLAAGMLSARGLGGIVGALGSSAGLAAIAPPAALIAGIMALGSAMQSLSDKIGQASRAGIEYNAKIETLSTNLKVLTGDVSTSTKLFNDLKDFAAKTPFEIEGLASATQTLLSFGIETENLLPTLKMLGDVSMGDKSKLDRLTLAFGQISSTGRLMGQDLLQLINAGFNPLQIISEKTKISIADLKKAMEDGKISTEMVAEAFKIATSEGGQFFKGMEEGSKTFNGQLSTLNDNINNLLGNALKPMFNFLTNSVLPALNTAAINANNIFGGIAKNFGAYNTSVQIMINEQRKQQGQSPLGFGGKFLTPDEVKNQLGDFGFSMPSGMFTPKFSEIKTESAIASLPNLIKSIGNDTAKETKSASEKAEKELSSFVDKVKSQAERFRDALDLFSKATTEKLSGETLLARLKGQLNILKGWQSALSNLRGRLGEDSPLYQDLLQRGPQAAGQIVGISRLRDSRLGEYESLYNYKSSLVSGLGVEAVSGQMLSDKKVASVVVNIQNAYGDGVDEIADKITQKLRMAGVY